MCHLCAEACLPSFLEYFSQSPASLSDQSEQNGQELSERADSVSR